MPSIYGSYSRGWRLRLDYSISQNIAANTSTISMTLYVYDGTGYSQNESSGEAYYIIQGEKRWSPYYYGSTGWYTLGSKTITIKHNADGTGRVTLSGEWDCGFDSSHTPRHLTVSGTVTLPTIPRVSTLSFGKFTMGRPGRITIKREAGGFTETMTYTFGRASGTIASKTGAGYVDWTPPLSLANQIPNAPSGAGEITLTTYNGSTAIGSKRYPFTATVPSDAAPSITAAISQQEQIAALGIYVQNQSRLQVALTGTAKYGATIKSYSGTVSGAAFSQQKFTADLPQAGSVTVAYGCKDSRGFSANGSQTIKVLPWSAPSVTAIKAGRCTADGTADPLGDHATVTFSAEISPLANKNTAVYTLKYRPVGSTSWQTLPISTAAGDYAPSGASIIIPVDTGTAYDILVEAEDRFKRQDSLPVLLGSAAVFNRIDAKNNAMTWGEYRTKKDTFFIGGKMALETLNPARLAGGIEENILTPQDDLNAIVGSGFYYWGDTAIPNGPPEEWGSSKWCELIVAGNSQMAISLETGVRMQRCKKAGAWLPWECVNPPMNVGVEYRTTEKYLDKPVYVMVVDMGHLPNNSFIQKRLPAGARPIRATGVMSNSTTIPGHDPATGKTVELSCYDERVWIKTDHDYSAMTAIATVWYTKTTD